MKAIKMIGLAALSALMAMAFVGASSAMAESTTLCSNDTETLSQSEIKCTEVTHVHETSVTNAKLLTSFGTTECEVLFLGDVKSTGSPLVLEGTFTYSSCKLGSTNCTAKEENGPAEIKVLKEGHETSKITGEGLVHLVCGSSIDCSYNGVGLVGTGKGPLLSTQKNGEATTNEATTNKETGGFLCPKTSKLDITTTPLTATYLHAPSLHYCVEYEHKTNGRYTDAKCTKEGAGAYDLVIGPPGIPVNTAVCVHMNVTGGLWKTIVLGVGVCLDDNATELTGSLYEKGTIVLVQ